ncbi:MAG: hypothetical protein ACI4Q8_00180 [Ruminococcus sp.]
MNIAVVGMGIIGGSFCKAFKKYTHHYIIGINRTQSTLQQAFDCGAIDEKVQKKALVKLMLLLWRCIPRQRLITLKNTEATLKAVA